jgi:hypothetical protein
VRRANLEELVVGNPLAAVGLEHLRRQVADAVHHALGQRGGCTIGHETTHEIAVVDLQDLAMAFIRDPRARYLRRRSRGINEAT